MDRRRRGRGRRRLLRAGMAVAPVALLVGFWGPVKAGLLAGLERGAVLAGATLGLAPAAPGVAEASPLEVAAGRAESETWAPSFDATGALRVPADYREWVFVGAAVGLSYAEDGSIADGHGGPGNFTHVYLDPDSLAAFRTDGTFREGTTFLLDIHRPASGVSIARNGWFEGERIGVHAAVKDSSRFEGGWGYFNVAGDRGHLVRSSTCRTCHVEHGAIDNVFVQFYPLLRELPVAAAALSGSGMR